jgi:PAS domain S-box-containing protein
MKIQSKILVSIAVSVAVAAVIALIAFSFLKGMKTELARIRVYDRIIGKTHALDSLAGYLKEGSRQSDIRQVRGTLRSLDDLLSKMTSEAPREEALIKQLQRNNRELGSFIDQMFATVQGVDNGIERERRNLFASQIWMKVKFISDDTDRLKDISDSMIISAQGKTGATVIALIIILALTNGIIYFISGRGIVRGLEALRQSEERFRVTLGSIGDAVIATDASGLVTFLNAIGIRLTGWQLAEASGQPIQSVFKIINEKTRDPAENIVERVLREGNIVSLANHTAIITRDGREIPIEDSAAPIRDRDGGVSGVVLVFHDVTEKRRAQEALRESTEKLRLFIEHAPASLAMFDRSMRYLSASRRWLADYNLERTDLTGLSHYEVFPEIPEYWRKVHLRGLAGEVVRAESDRFDRADGSVQWLRWEVRPWYDAAGDVGGIVIFTEDITERKRAEEELHNAKEEAERRAKELETLMDAVPALIWISRDTECLSMTGNRAVYEFLRMPGGANVSKTAPEAERPVHFKALKDGVEIPPDELCMPKAAKGHGVQGYELEFLFDDGTSKITLGNIAPLQDPAGHVYGSIAAFVDITDRKRTEEALRESEARFRAVQELSPDGFLILRPVRNADGSVRDFTWVYQNEALARINGTDGTDPQAMIGRSVCELFPGHDESAFHAAYKHVAETGETRVIEAPFQGGSIQKLSWFRVAVVPMENDIAILTQDMTEHRRMEEELRESRSRLDLALRSAQIGVWRLDIAEGKRVFDDQVCRLLGIDAAEFTGTPDEFFRVVHPDDHEAVYSALARTLEHGEPYETEYRAVMPDGSIRHITARGSLLRDDSGEAVRINGLIWDITDRKRAEEEVRESKAKLEAALASMSDAVFVSDAEGRFLDFNDAFATFHRFRDKNECLKTLVEYPDILDVYMADGQLAPLDMWAVPRALRGETVTNAEYTLRRKDTGETWVGSYSFGPIRDKGGSIVGSVVVGRDITERKQAEETLRSTVQRFHRILSNIFGGILVVSGDNRVEFANQSFCDLFNIGEAPSDLIGQTDTEMLQKVSPAYLDSEANADRIRQILSLGNRVEGEEVLMRDGRVLLRDYVPILVDGVTRGRMWQHRDITERKQMEEALRRSESEFKLLSEISGKLLVSEDPQGLVNELCRTVMAHLDCQAFFNFMVEESAGKLRLNAFAGIPEEEAVKIEWLDFGVAVCGCAARDGNRIVSEDIFNTPDIRTDLVRSYGIQAYACHPLKVGARVIGTLSFGTKTRPNFTHRELAVMKTVADQVAVAMERIRLVEGLRKSRDELELRVEERTANLFKASEELREKAEIIDLAHDAIIVRDTESRINFWSKGAQDTYGFTGDEALGQVTHEFLKAAFPAALEEITRTVLEDGEWKGEIRHTKKNGQRLVVDSRWAIKAGGDGSPAGFLEVNRDITPRKIAEEEFRKADRALRTLSECNQAMVRQTDEIELLQRVCRIVIETGGYRMAWVGLGEDDKDKTVRPVASAGYDDGYLNQARITWADTERGRGPTGMAIRAGKTFVSQNALLNPAYAPWRSEGIRRGYASSIALPLIVERKIIGALTIYASEPDAFDEGEASLLNNLAENLAYGIASIRSAEKRSRAEEDLRIYASRLEVINKELQDFAFVAAHDLQEPLRKIQTFCDMAIRRCAPALDPTGRDYMERVINSATRMRSFLTSLLRFSRIAIRPEPLKEIDLNSFVREAADVFETLVKESDCKIEIQNLPRVEADENQMLQLFQNLIGNALKFHGERTPHIKVYSRSERNGICEIFIEDNGIGFDQQFADLIFKPFQKLHGREQYEGTGMGLAICRKIVERHGGSIRAESEIGKGSKFIVRLPVKQPRQEANIAG